MKIKQLALTAALALAGLAFSHSALAQTTVTYTDGDVFMGFHSTTASNDYLWDLGQFSLFTNKPVGFHLALGNINTDLSAVFGGTWATSNTIQWGAAGTHDFDSSFNQIANLYATKAEPNPGTLATPWLRQGINAQGITASTIETMASSFDGNQSTANNPQALIQSANGNSWASYQPGGANSPANSFLTWTPTIEAPQTPGSGTGIPSTRLDLFEILPSASGNPPSTYLGTFSIDSLGNVNFDVLSAVPEPSTYALLIAGGIIAFVAVRRQQKSRA